MRVVILKDYRESPKKCSILPLAGRPGIEFVAYDPHAPIGRDFTGFTLLHPEGEPAGRLGSDERLLLVDANWPAARGIYRKLDAGGPALRRIAINGFRTAYPWKKNSPPNTLASVEALFVVHHLAGIRDDTLLDHYYFREQFLDLNREALARYSRI